MSGANLEGIFDPNQFAPTMGGGQGLPISDKNGHLVVITGSEMKPVESGNGTKLVLTLAIQDGPHAGSEGNWNLNIGNANVVAVKIAQQELACICHAVGYLQALQNTSVLHGKPFRVVVAQQKKNPEYTEVVEVRRADGSKTTDPPGGAVAGPAPVTGPPPQMAQAVAAPVAQPTAPAQQWPVQTQVLPPGYAPPVAAAPVAQPTAPAAPSVPWNQPPQA